MASPQPISSDNLTYLIQIRRDQVNPAVNFALELLKKHNAVFETSPTTSTQQAAAADAPADKNPIEDTKKSSKRVHLDTYASCGSLVRGEIDPIYSIAFTAYSESCSRVFYVCSKCLLEKKNTEVWSSCTLATVRKNKLGDQVDIIERCDHKLDFGIDESSSSE